MNNLIDSKQVIIQLHVSCNKKKTSYVFSLIFYEPSNAYMQWMVHIQSPVKARTRMLSNPQTIAFWCTIFLIFFFFFTNNSISACVLWCLTAEMWKYEYFQNEFLIGFWRYSWPLVIRICVKDEDEKWHCKMYSCAQTI